MTPPREGVIYENKGKGIKEWFFHSSLSLSLI
jgi:hypothetical protein